jgi:hypothetical protein
MAITTGKCADKHCAICGTPPALPPASVLDEIRAEREYQVRKWGTDADLHVNTPMDFVGYIAHHSSRWFGGGFRPYSRETLQAFRKQMVKVAALALAAIEHADAILNGEVTRTDVIDYGEAADRD